jgi:hypothetical protein
MGLWLEAVGRLSIWRKRKETPASGWQSIQQIRLPARLSAFSLQASPLGLQWVLSFPRSMIYPDYEFSFENYRRDSIFTA